jgi:hypothetical protein
VKKDEAIFILRREVGFVNEAAEGDEGGGTVTGAPARGTGRSLILLYKEASFISRESRRIVRLTSWFGQKSRS